MFGKKFSIWLSGLVLWVAVVMFSPLVQAASAEHPSWDATLPADLSARVARLNYQDQDEDGVYDHLDRCPGTAPGVPVDCCGCPVDRDEDGVRDNLDRCLNTPKGLAVDEWGCHQATVEKQTAPSPREQTVQFDIEFDTGSAEIKTGYHDEMKRLADLAAQHPDAGIRVEGHTDDTGSEKYNLGLSIRRAESVKQSLVTRYNMNADRISTEGFGASRPASDNATEAGRQKNRRTTILMNYFSK
ncbi:MAG: OmpA family protein [Proteobacteria bacterium]|nr:OmpA family protein [Pseudomonadota bacterium]